MSGLVLVLLFEFFAVLSHPTRKSAMKRMVAAGAAGTTSEMETRSTVRAVAKQGDADFRERLASDFWAG